MENRKTCVNLVFGADTNMKRRLPSGAPQTSKPLPHCKGKEAFTNGFEAKFLAKKTSI